MMQTDIKTAIASGNGTIYASRTRVRGLLVVPGSSVGLIVLRDGGGSGTVMFSIPTLASGTPFSVLIPGEGVLFSTDVYGAMSNAAVTVMYG
jgi:hypothetical protein